MPRNDGSSATLHKASPAVPAGPPRGKALPGALLAALIATFGWIAPAHAAVLKLATIAPEGSAWMKEMRAGAAEIGERTDGRVELKFYGGGVMGNDDKVLRKVRIGQLHGGAFTASSLADRYPDVNIYGLPLMFESLDEVEYVRARIDERLREGMKEAGFVSFGFAGGGFARLMSNRPVRSLDDLQGQKVWVPEGDRFSYEAMASLDLSPVALPVTDVLTGLQTGLLDIVATPPVGALVLQWHTKVKYITELPILYTLGFLAVDRRAFERLNEADRAVVREVMGEVYERFDEINRKDNEQALAALDNAGLTLVEPRSGAIESWREVVMASNEKLVEDGALSEDLFEDVLALLAEYRNQRPGLHGAAR